jgi:hypothetical protein
MAKSGRFIFWAPRILSILFILFLALFSLDVFDGNYGFWGTLLALLIHNIPSIVLAVIVAIAWKHELVGVIAFALAGLVYVCLILHNILRDLSNVFMLGWIVTISGPAFLVAILYYIGWKKAGHKKSKRH